MDKDTLIKLRQAAKDAAQNAYCGYSNFPVGAALLLEDGRLLPGCNVENVSFGLTNCAERTALFTAVASGVKKDQMRALLIYMPGDKLYSPCGACRQVIGELMPADALVISSCDHDETLNWRVSELLPAAFNF